MNEELVCKIGFSASGGGSLMARNNNDRTDIPRPATTAASPTKPDYSEAVRKSRKFLENWMAGNGQGLIAGRNLADPIDWQAVKDEVLGAAMLRKQPSELVEWASSDSDGWNALSLGVAEALEMGRTIPTEAREWLVLVLRGKANKPHCKVGRHSASGLHNAIYIAVYARVHEGMKATRNDASPPVSACDAVADALAELGLNPTTYYGVKRVWLNIKSQTKQGIPRT